MEDVQFKLVTYNILAPCYHRIVVDGQKAMEADYEDMYMQRNRGIIERLKEEDADIVCIQEFWGANENLMELYMKELCGRSEDGGNQLYQMTEMRRSSHWRARDDGLAIFVRDRARSGQPQLKIEDTKRIVFHDCGDRVALMLLLSIAPPAPSTAPPQHFICVNTHLLFPHNQYSSNIRLREVTKILGFVEAYRQRDLCTDVCGRADVRIPVIVTGDFNGSPRGAVFQLMKQQNFQVAYEEHCRSITPVQEAVQDVQQVKNLQADINTDTLGVSGSASGDDCGCASDSTVTTSSTTDMKAKIDLRSIDIKEELAGVIETTNLEPWMKWVSHRSHQQKNVRLI